MTEPSTPLFYFGHGLSYASGFAVSGVNCAPPPASTLFQAGDSFVISGQVAAAAPTDPASRLSLLLFYSQNAPTKYTRFDHQLMGFVKVSVPAGGAGSAPFSLTAKVRDLDAFDLDANDYVVYTGRCERALRTLRAARRAPQAHSLSRVRPLTRAPLPLAQIR